MSNTVGAPNPPAPIKCPACSCKGGYYIYSSYATNTTATPLATWVACIRCGEIGWIK